MIAVIDYGVGNLFSLVSSLRAIGMEAEITGDPDEIRAAEKLILPGVGAFRDAANALSQKGLDKVVKEECAKGKPLLGICLGMQLLFDESYEYGTYKGLGLIPGKIVPITDVIPEGLDVPHIGWNALEIKKHGDSILLNYIKEGDYVYFVHSYYAKTDEKYIVASTEYGADLTATVRNGNVIGCQFHPEKSGDVGLKILRAFCEL